MTIRTLQKLSVNQIQNGDFPLKSLLKDSLYYPSCDIDGELIRYCNMHFDQLGICSYVYADYGTGRERLESHLKDFRGYHLVASRILTREDIGADKHFQIPDGIDIQEYLRYYDGTPPFAEWVVYQRDAEFNNHHGPIRFSLLFLGAEAIATYCGLYVANDITPKALAIIQPGHAFGGNWTNFRDPDGPMTQALFMGRSLPEYIFNGGYCHDYYDLPWPWYRRIDMVSPYYPAIADSALSVWQGTVVSLRVYDGNRESNQGRTLQVLDNPKTMPHEYVSYVSVRYGGQSYEAECGTYNDGDTLRGEEIKELILRNNWQPGHSFHCQLIIEGDVHTYSIIDTLWPSRTKFSSNNLTGCTDNIYQ